MIDRIFALCSGASPGKLAFGALSGEQIGAALCGSGMAFATGHVLAQKISMSSTRTVEDFEIKTLTIEYVERGR